MTEGNVCEKVVSKCTSTALRRAVREQGVAGVDGVRVQYSEAFLSQLGEGREEAEGRRGWMVGEASDTAVYVVWDGSSGEEPSLVLYAYVEASADLVG